MPRVNPETGLKICAVCLEEKSVIEFPKNRCRPDKHCYSCRKCTSIYQKPAKTKYREKNRAITRIKSKEYQDRKRLTDPEFVRKARAASKAYYHANKARLNAKRIIYARENPIGRAISTRHHHKRNGIILQFPRLDLFKLKELYAASDDKCFYCTQKLNGKFEYDHFIPLARGGEHTVENLRISCKPCNRLKKVQMPRDFMAKILHNKLTEVCHRFATL